MNSESFVKEVDESKEAMLTVKRASWLGIAFICEGSFTNDVVCIMSQLLRVNCWLLTNPCFLYILTSLSTVVEGIFLIIHKSQNRNLKNDRKIRTEKLEMKIEIKVFGIEVI